MPDHGALPRRLEGSTQLPYAVRRGAGATTCALALIFLAGAYLRRVGLGWGDGFLLHPDERFLALVHDALEPARSLHEYFDTAHSPLNPNNRGYPFFVYGLLPLFTVRGLLYCLGDPASLLGRILLGTDGSGMTSVTLVGRGLSVGADLGSLGLLFATGKRLYGRATGILAAALYAGAVLPIQQAHFSTVDAYANLFVFLAFWVAVRMREAPRWSDDVLLGVSTALGAACKLSAAPVFLLGPLAVALRLARRCRGSVAGAEEERDAAPAAVHEGWIRAAVGLNASMLIALLVFRVAQPYAFVPARSPAPPASATDALAGRLSDLVVVRLNSEWRDQLKLLRRQVEGQVDLPPMRQWANRSRWAHAWLAMVRFGLGWPLGLAAWCGWACALVESLRGRGNWTRHALPVSWVAFVFLSTASQLAVTMRYFLPAYPSLTLLAAWILVRIVAAPRDDDGAAARQRHAGVALVALVVLGTYAWAFAFTRIYTRPHTRVAASRWIYEHVPRGAAIATEGTWDDDLPLPLPGHESPDQAYRLLRLEMSAEDTPEKQARLQQVLDGSDYVVISSNRFYASLSRLPRRWPMSIDYYGALFGARLGFELARDFSAPPTLGPLRFDDQEAEESFTVYDHPRVFVFRKTTSYDATRTAAILGRADLAGVVPHGAATAADTPARIDLPPPCE